MDRYTRQHHGEEAYQLQKKAGLEGMVYGGVITTIAVVALHYSWPGFRVQTTAGKVFLISAGVMSGLVINAEYKLQAYEASQRYQFNYARRRAKYELTKEGKIATEPEIKQWTEQWQAAKQAREQAAVDELAEQSAAMAVIHDLENKLGVVSEAIQDALPHFGSSSSTNKAEDDVETATHSPSPIVPAAAVIREREEAATTTAPALVPRERKKARSGGRMAVAETNVQEFLGKGDDS